MPTFITEDFERISAIVGMLTLLALLGATCVPVGGKAFGGPFVTSRLAYSYELERTGKLTERRVMRIPLGDVTCTPAHELWIYFLRAIPGMSCQDILTIPYGLIFWILSMLYLCRAIGASKRFSLAVLVITALDPTVTSYIGNLAATSFIMGLYPIFLVGFLKALINYDRRYMIVAVISFCVLQYMHPVSALWVLAAPTACILMTVFLSGQAYLRISASPSASKSRFVHRIKIWTLFLCIFFTSSSLPYVGVSIMQEINVLFLLEKSVDRIISGTLPLSTKPEVLHMHEAGSPGFTILGIVYHIVNACVVAYYFVRLMIYRKTDAPTLLSLLGIVLVSGIMTVSLYLFSAGYPGTKYNLLMFPVASMLAVRMAKNEKRRRLILILFLACLLCLNSGKVYFKEEPFKERSLALSLDESLEWVYQYGAEQEFVTDFYSGAYITMEWARRGANLSRIHDISDRVYVCIRNDEYSDPHCSFLVHKQVDYLISVMAMTESFRTSSWKSRTGLGEVLYRRQYNIVYSGNLIWLRRSE